MRKKFNVFLTLLLALVVQITFAQEKSISGVVTDATDGSPMPGVNVMIKGTTNGAATDFDGKYSIKANVGDVLVFSYTGYDTVKKTVGSSNKINVVLKEDSDSLGTVVINAIGIPVKKRSQKALSIANVKAKTLKSSGENDPIAALSGKVSGVQINLASGDPGASANIVIRGPKSILLSTKPLFVVDGVPILAGIGSSGTDGVERPSSIGDINPNDIDNIKILKGGAAAALWGSKGANGVVLITTKSGKFSDKGKISVTFNSSYSSDQSMTEFPLQNTYGQGKDGSWSTNSGSWGDKISARAGGDDVVDASGAYFVDQDGKKWYPILTKNSTETFNNKNRDAVIHSGSVIKNGLQISAGNKNAKYYFTISNLKQEGVFTESTYDKTNVKFSNTLKASAKFKVSTSLQYTNTKQNAIQKGSNLSGLLLGLYRTPADFDNSGYVGEKHVPGSTTVYGSQRSYRKPVGTNYKQGPGYNNPLFTVNEQDNPYKSDHVFGGANFVYTANEWLTLTFKSGVDYATSKSASYFPVNSGESAKGSYSTGVSSYLQFNTDFIGQISKELNKNLNMDLLLGVNWYTYKSEFAGGGYNDFLLNTDTPNTSNATSENKNPSFGSSEKRKNAGYGSATFSYKDMLYATFTGRGEVSSTFGGFIFYPSASLAWDFSKLKGSNNNENSILNSGTLRTSWSKVGNEPFAYLLDNYYVGASDSDGWGSSWSAGSYDGSIWRGTTQGNPDIKPEVTTELEFGVDLKMFKRRMNLSATYYNSNSEDLILYVRQPASSGFAYKWENAAAMTNKGFEIDLGYDIIQKNDFNWNIGGTYSNNTNEVTDLAGADYIALNGFTSTSSGVAVGEAYGVLRTGDFKRDDSGKMVLDANGFPSHGDLIFAGDPNPDFKAAIHTDLKYKKFSLRVLFDGSFGGKSWDGTEGALTYFGRTTFTAEETTVSAADAASIKNIAGTTIDALPYATLNQDGSYTVRGNLNDFGGGQVLLDQHWYRSLGGGFGPVGTQFFKDATWIKLREITLGYTLKADILKKTKIKSIHFGITGRNLFLWTKDETWGIDPESNLTGSSRGRGLQYFNHPTTRSFVFSTSIKF